MYDALFYGFPELLNKNYIPWTFNLNQPDCLILQEPHLPTGTNTTYQSHQLICDTFCICDMSGGGDSFYIG